MVWPTNVFLRRGTSQCSTGNIFLYSDSSFACITPTSLGSFCRSPKIHFAESISFCYKHADKQLYYIPWPVQYSILQSSKAAAQVSATECNELRAFVKLALSLEDFRWQNCYGAKADWGHKYTDPREDENPRKGDLPVSTASRLYERQGMNHCTQTKVHWKARSSEAHPTLVYSVQFKDLTIQNFSSLRQLSLSNYNTYFLGSLPPCLEREILQHFSKKLIHCWLNRRKSRE